MIYDEAIVTKGLKEIHDEENWRCAYLDPEQKIYCHVEFTGHQYFNSPYESCDSCGNCNGARCDYCDVHWILEEWIGDTDEFKEITTVTTRELTDYGPVKKAVKEFIESRNNGEGSTNE